MEASFTTTSTNQQHTQPTDQNICNSEQKSNTDIMLRRINNGFPEGNTVANLHYSGTRNQRNQGYAS